MREGQIILFLRLQLIYTPADVSFDHERCVINTEGDCSAASQGARAPRQGGQRTPGRRPRALHSFRRRPLGIPTARNSFAPQTLKNRADFQSGEPREASCTRALAPSLPASTGQLRSLQAAKGERTPGAGRSGPGPALPPPSRAARAGLEAPQPRAHEGHVPGDGRATLWSARRPAGPT